MFLLALSALVVLVFCAAVAFEVYKKFDRQWQLYMKLPGPKPVFFFGNILEMSGTTTEMFASGLVRASKWPKCYRFTMGHIRGYVCYNADDVEYLISGHTTTVKGLVYKFLVPWLGTGLLLSEGDKWYKRRRLLTPAFHFNILQGFVKVFNEETKKLVKILHNVCEADYLDVIPYISEFTLNSINDTSMGVKPEKMGKGTTYKSAILTLAKVLAERLKRPWFYNDQLYKLSWGYWQSKKILNILHKYTDIVIKKREENFHSGDQRVGDGMEGSYSTRKRLAMMDLLLSEKQRGTIDYKGIREEVDTFMFEGHDTVSMTICYALLLLANNKTIQEEVRREIKEEIGDNEDPDCDELNRLKYMERCIKEVLRLYPSVAHIVRTTIKEGVSPSGRVIPDNCMVLIELHNLHRDPDVFPDPEKFDPDRFLPENCNGRHPYAYIPFSAGPRNCIGQKYAILEIKAVLCGILRNFNLEPVHQPKDIVIVLDFVLRPNENGIKVKFVPRLKE